MAEETVFHVDIVGLRDLMGRFASMSSVGLVAIQLEEAEAMAGVIEDVFRTQAPRSRGPAGGRKSPGHFSEGIVAESATATGGFEISVTTDNPQLRTWLAEGTGEYGPTGQRIYPLYAQAMGPVYSWIGGQGPLFFSSIAGMPPNPWEEEALAEVEPLVDELGSKIGVRVVQGLSNV